MAKILDKLFRRTDASEFPTAHSERRDQEVNDIKKQMKTDLKNVKHRVDKAQKNTNIELESISVMIDSVTYKYAAATGAKKRGL